MFDTLAAELNAGAVDPAWVTCEPAPGTPAYESFLASYEVYEAQQIAFWKAYAAGEAVLTDGLPDLSAARTDEGLLDRVTRCQQRENAAAGATLRAIADYATRRLAEPTSRYDETYLGRSVEAEIGIALRIPPPTASVVVELAVTLARRLPQTFGALEEGLITRRAAQMIADETGNLDANQCARLEAAVLPDAQTRSYRSLRDKVRREVKRLDADAVRKRAEQAKEERCVWVKDEHDGMATLCLYVPAHVAQAIYAAIHDHVMALQALAAAAAADAPLVLAARDDRRIGAQRADALVDVIATGLGVDLWTPPVTQSSFLTEEQIAGLDRHAGTYRPSEAMKRAVRNRDKHCRFPGCRRPARFCDLDHSIAFVKVGGKLVGPGTVYFNLGCLCRFHHQVKQLPGWHLEQDRGRFIWTTPTGIRIIVHPPPDDGDEPADFASYNPNEPIPF